MLEECQTQQAELKARDDFIKHWLTESPRPRDQSHANDQQYACSMPPRGGSLTERNQLNEAHLPENGSYLILCLLLESYHEVHSKCMGLEKSLAGAQE